MQNLPLAKLVVDDALYPRQNINDHHIATMVRTLEGGHKLPPIVVWEKGKKYVIVDGVHRYHAALRSGANDIEAEVRKYDSTKEAFRDAVLLNTAHGLRLDTYDTLKVLEVGEGLGLREIDLAGMLRTSVAHLRAIKPRYATVTAAREGVRELRQALKTPVRHLAGTTISTEQAQAIQSAPGQSYLLTTRQLLSAIKFRLLPPKEDHPVLWEELENLYQDLGRIL